MSKIKVLFICTHNSARSQMAEAFLNSLAPENFHAESAGIEAGKLNPIAVEVMKESGIDISANQTKDLSGFNKKGKVYHYVITVCGKADVERCPIFPVIKKRLHWSFPDPAAASGNEKEKLEFTRKVRDSIKKKVAEFIYANT